MRYQYLGLCVSGLEEVAANILCQRLKDLQDLRISGGAVGFSTDVPYNSLNLFCFNNLFQVVCSAPAAPTKTGLERFLRGLPSARGDWAACREHPKKFRTFRLVTSCQNQLVSMPKTVKTAVEQKLRVESGLAVDRSLPDSEFWAVVRSDGQAYLLKRLTRHRAYDKLLSPGELHPELAYLLCWLSEPRPGDVVVDPFCGYGSIPLQRCKRFSYAKLFAFDSDSQMVEITREKLPARENIRVERKNVLTLSQRLPPESVDAFITDPPWGIYREMELDLEEFYRLALGQMVRVLKPDGRIVLLTAAKAEQSRALEETPSLALTARYDILVSGKKAAVFVMEKMSVKVTGM